MWRSLERMQIHLRGFSAFNADCRTMNEALFDSHDPATVAVRLRRLECRVDWNVYVCCLNGHRISGSVLNIVCQTFGITLAPISAPLSLAVPEPQNEGILSILLFYIVIDCKKRAGKVGNFVTSSAAPVSYHGTLENSATTCLTHVWLTAWHWRNEWIITAGGVEMDC